jgi:hypothetical protein
MLKRVQDDDPLCISSPIMPATPSWPPQSTPRLFVEQPLAGVNEIRIDGPQAHYLLNVMRMRAGDPLKLFDNFSGEWLGVVDTQGKRDLVLRIDGKLRERENLPDLWLAAANWASRVSFPCSRRARWWTRSKLINCVRT